MILGSFFCARDRQRTIPDDLLPAVVDDLAVSKLRLCLAHPEDLIRVHQLMRRPLIHLKSLTLELSQEVPLSTTDFIDYLFDCNHLERVDIEYSARDASQWVTAYVERFIEADVVGRIVPTVAIRMDGDVQPDRPAICEKAIETTGDASPFFSDLDGDETTASCTLYEFENPARKELLRVCCGSATRRLVLDGIRSTHFFYLHIVELA